MKTKRRGPRKRLPTPSYIATAQTSAHITIRVLDPWMRHRSGDAAYRHLGAWTLHRVTPAEAFALLDNLCRKLDAIRPGPIPAKWPRLPEWSAQPVAAELERLQQLIDS